MSLKETYKILPTLLIVDKISTFPVLHFCCYRRKMEFKGVGISLIQYILWRGKRGIGEYKVD